MRGFKYNDMIATHAARFFTEGARRMIAAGVSATLVFSLTACGATGTTTDAPASKGAAGEEVATEQTTAADSDIYEVARAFTIDTSSLFSARDRDASYDAGRATTISLADTGVTIKGEGASAEGSTVTIANEGTYVVEGTVSDGRIVVDAADDAKVQIVLAGANVTSSGPSALYVRNADKVFLTLATDGNAMCATGADAEEDEHNLDGCIFASSDLTVNGTGSLNVKSEQGAGIVAKDELTLSGANLTVTGAGHAVDAKDSLAVDAGTYTLVSTAGDAIHVEHDTNGAKGFVYVAGGTFDLNAADDGIHASNDILIDGGTFKIAATDDGIHSEYDVVINDGAIDVSESAEGIEGATFTQNGGDVTAKASDDGVNATGYPSAEKDARATELASKGNGDWPKDLAEPDGFMEGEQRDSTGQEADGQTSQGDAGTEGSQEQDPQGEPGIEGDPDQGLPPMAPEGDPSQMGERMEPPARPDQEMGQPPMGQDGNREGRPGGPVGDGQMGEPPVGPREDFGQGGPRQMGDGNQTDEAGDANGAERTDRGGMRGPGAFMMDVDETADLTINGGTLRVDSSGDGLDSNGTIHFNGGEIYVSGPTSSGNGAIDCGTEVIATGGILVATGSSGMVEPFSSKSTQATMIVGAAGSEGDAVTLTDASGKVICTFTPTKSYQCVEITSPEIKQGETYTLAYGSKTTTVVMDSLNYVDVTATVGGMGGPGGGRGQRTKESSGAGASDAPSTTGEATGQATQSS